MKRAGSSLKTVHVVTGVAGKLIFFTKWRLEEMLAAPRVFDRYFVESKSFFCLSLKPFQLLGQMKSLIRYWL